jgi:membrane protease YdiL (CAAX protease family)
MMNIPFKRPLLAIPVIILGTASLLYFGALAPDAISAMLPISLAGNRLVDAKLSYQIVTFILASVIMALVYWLAPHNARRFYKPGNLDAPAEPVRWLGIQPMESWKTVGRSFSIIISLATGAYIYFNVARGHSLEPEHLSLLLWIPVLSAMNSFTEEAITRLSVVTALDGIVSRPAIYVISALIFAIPHYFGTPGGILGSLMAGFLGWLLAKSVAETEGMFWAWFIHFLQDVVIFGGLFLAVV